MDRLRQRLSAAVALLCALVASGCTRSRPNVLLIVIDTVRADHLGCYGYPRPTSPAIDALAKRGVRFARAQSTSSWTGASVASILTGLYPAEHGVERSTSALGEVPTMAESFRRAGYATAAISANPVFVCPRVGFDRGFDDFRVLHGAPVKREEAVKMIPLDTSFQSFVAVATAEITTNAALEWLGDASRQQRPWFLYVHYLDPHADYFPPAELAARFGVRPGARLSGVDQRAALLTFRAPAAAEDLQTLIGLYDAEIAYTDLHLARLLEWVERQGGDSLVAVTADHGEEFGDHGGLTHTQTLFQEQLHVPLILTGARLAAGRVVEAPVSLVSLWATLAELVGLEAPPSRAGGSLAAAALGGATPAGDLYADLDRVSPGIPWVHRRAVREDELKLLQPVEGPASLFRLSDDPGEKSDLASSAAAEVERLAAALTARDRVMQAAQGAAPAAAVELSPETKARMRALGYGD